jgi:hypothetical protein
MAFFRVSITRYPCVHRHGANRTRPTGRRRRAVLRFLRRRQQHNSSSSVRYVDVDDAAKYGSLRARLAEQKIPVVFDAAALLGRRASTGKQAAA